jgi:hypothetical protein
MPSRLHAVLCFRGAMRPTSATGKRILERTAGHVRSCRDGRRREQCGTGSLVGAMRRDGSCGSLTISLRRGSNQ